MINRIYIFRRRILTSILCFLGALVEGSCQNDVLSRVVERKRPREEEGMVLSSMVLRHNDVSFKKSSVPIIGDVPVSVPEHELSIVFYTKLLKEQENMLIQLFCERAKMAPSYWAKLTNDLKRKMRCYDLLSDASSSYRYVTYDKDTLKIFFKNRGCGSIPIEYVESVSSENSNVITARGVQFDISATFFDLEQEDQYKYLDRALVYLRSNDAFNIQVMWDRILDLGDFKNKHSLIEILHDYMIFAKRRCDLVIASIDPMNQSRSDKRSAIDYMEEFLRFNKFDLEQIMEEVGHDVRPWIDNCLGTLQDAVALDDIEHLDQLVRDDLAVHNQLDDGIGDVQWSSMDKKY